MIEVQDLCKYYKVHVRPPGLRAAVRSLFRRTFTTVKAVDRISFRIGEGEIVAFLGPNGAGKTTTMKVLTGLLHPMSGTVVVDGFVPYKQSNAFKRRISLVMGQKSQLMWDIPAAETFLVNKEIYELSDREYRRNLDELADLLQLGPLMTKPVRQLSLGERMKCELAAALLHRPSLVFLDEPTIGLDVHMQEAVRRFIAEYNRHYRATVLLTSHYMADVTALCERVMVINRGRLLYDGGIGELTRRYAPYKTIKLAFAEDVDPAALRRELDGAARLVRCEPRAAELETARERVSDVSSRVLGRFPVQDLTIEDPSMESVIGRAFRAEEEVAE
jgi:ABC-2 type transport system ATP-binding protein